MMYIRPFLQINWRETMTNTVRQYRFSCKNTYDTHQIFWREWGDAQSSKILFCVHGLTRNSKDFDPLAKRLAQSGYRVIAPDMVGRGESNWLENPLDYGMHQYVADCQALIRHLQISKLNWLGTSMGGLIGIVLASQDNPPIQSLILNDIGPFVPASALQKIAHYVGQHVYFRLWQDAYDYILETYQAYGISDEKDWWYLTRCSFHESEDGLITRNYDPAIATAFQGISEQDVDIWSLYARIDTPVMVLRGALSEVLLKSTAMRMMETRPHADIYEFSDIGHAPALLDSGQISIIESYLEQG